MGVIALVPASAAPPDDLELDLSLYLDSDGVVQPDSTISVRAQLKFTGAAGVGALSVSDAALRIAGNLEWDDAGRRTIQSSTSRIVTAERGGSTGEAVAVQDGAAPNDDIQVIAAPDATVDGIAAGGAVHVWVDGSFNQRLTGEPTDNVSGTQFWGRYNGGFGSSVDVGSGVIVVGAPFEDGALRSRSSSLRGSGAAYVFERNDDGQWEQTAKLTVGRISAFINPESQRAPLNFGEHVAISDDGSTIVVSQFPSSLGSNRNWRASAHVFTRPATGWTDMNTNHANVTSLLGGGGDVDIAGDGSVVAVGQPTRRTASGQIGGVHVFNRPGAAWTDGAERQLQADATLTPTNHETNPVRVGSDIAIDQSGGAIVANGASQTYSQDRNPNDPVTGWPGSAFVWVRSGGAWANTDSATATLTDSGASNGDRFGRTVAISDSGDRVVVGRNPWSGGQGFGAIHVFDKPGGGWANSSAADTVLGEYPWATAWSLALDGESTLLAGVPITAAAYQLDLSRPDPERSTVWWLDPDCTASSSNDIVTQTCSLVFELPGEQFIINSWLPEITIPAGTPDGTYTISAAATVDGVSYSDTVEISVRDVDEVAEVTLDFATDPGGRRFISDYADTSDDKPYPSAIAPGETTRLRLSVLNDNGEAAGPDVADGVAKILFTTTAGTFSQGAVGGWPVWLINRFSPLNRWIVNCEGGSDQPTCAVALTNLSADNADRIVISLAHPGADKPGTAEVRATVITNDGEVFNPPPLTVTFTGRAETLVLSEPAAGVLNVDAPPDSGADADNRDVLSLSVTAVDENDAQVDVPLGLPASPTPQQLNDAVRVVVKDPDGDVVPVSRYGGWDWTFDTDQERTSLDFKLQINASEENALELGEYTLELRIGGLKAERAFRVSGGPASLALGEPEGAFEPDGQFTITATVADAEGDPVPDGTAVQWEARSASTRAAVLVQLSADRTTSAGSASATYLAVGPGRATVSARTGGNASDAVLVTIPQASARADGDDDPAALIADGLRGRTSGLAPWLGRQATTASALLDGVTGINAIALWDAGGWQRYERSDPDSADFTIAPGAVILLEE